MILTDVNVLVYAYRRDAPDHRAYRRWLEEVLASDQAYGMADLVLSGFLRVVTHPRVFNPPSPLEPALRFARRTSKPAALRYPCARPASLGDIHPTLPGRPR